MYYILAETDPMKGMQYAETQSCLMMREKKVIRYRKLDSLAINQRKQIDDEKDTQRALH